MKEHEIQVLNPFGPKIFKIQLSNDVISKLIDITDKLIIDKNREKSNGCNLAGQIEEEVKIHTQILKDNKLYYLFIVLDIWLSCTFFDTWTRNCQNCANNMTSYIFSFAHIFNLLISFFINCSNDLLISFSVFKLNLKNILSGSLPNPF